MPQVRNRGCAPSNPIRSRRLLCASTIALGAVFAASPTAAAPIVQTYGVTVSDFGAPSTFGFTFGLPISVSGAANVSIKIVGALADGARDGAALTPTTPGALVKTDLGGGTAASAGSATSFAGAGGTAGVVQLSGVAVTDLGAPSLFGFVFGQPVTPTANRTLSQGAVAGGMVDGGTDGATLTGQLASGNVARFSGTNAGIPVDSYLVGPGPFSNAAPFLTSGSKILECTTGDPCDLLRSELSFLLSGGNDVVALLSRQEFGGDELAGDVLATFTGDGAGSVDCGSIGGCTFLTTTLNFDLSGGGDTAAIAIRVEIDDGTVVPEPSALSLLLAGLALAAARQRYRPA